MFITASLLMLTSKPDIYEGTIQGGDGVPLNTCSPWYGQENMLSFSASMTSSCLYLKWQICLFLWWDGSSSEALLFAMRRFECILIIDTSFYEKLGKKGSS